MALFLLACAAGDDTGVWAGDGEYHAVWSTTPDPPRAGEHSELVVTIVGPDGHPVEDLQSFHGALVHTFLIPHDLSAFDHAHQEDEVEISAEDLRSATFRVHVEPSRAGPYLLAFDFAHQDAYLSALDTLEVAGSPAQADGPVEDDAAEVTVGEVTARLEWAVPPVVGVEAIGEIVLTDATGADVTDVVQWGGADCHFQLVDWTASTFLHTHAWYPGMEDTTPGHDMPHLYPGPRIPVHYTFPASGRYRSWTQLARAAAPDEAITFPFDVVVP